MPSSVLASPARQQHWDVQEGSAQDLAPALENSEAKALVFVSHSRGDDERTRTVFETLKRASEFIDDLIDKRRKNSWEALIDALTAGGPGLIPRYQVEGAPGPSLLGTGEGESICLSRIHSGSCQPLLQAVHSDSISTVPCLPV